jgi:dienelactone hydrolase
MAYGIIPFLIHNRFTLAWPRIRLFFDAVRANEAALLPIGAAGFCWGGKPVLTLAHAESVTESGKPLVDAVFAGHPAGIALPDDVKRVTRPVSLAIGDQDITLPMTQVDSIRKTWDEETKDVPTEVVVYPGAGHGFCVRADPKNKKQFEQSQEAENQAVKWFQKHIR